MDETPEIPAEKRETSPFRKVAECLYRHESSKIYYALVKRSGKQYRRSLKTNDRKLAERKLSDYREKVGQLSLTASASQITFADLATRWLESLRPTLKPSSFARRQTSIDQISPYLGSLTLRQISSRVCEDWAGKRSPGIKPCAVSDAASLTIWWWRYPGGAGFASRSRVAAGIQMALFTAKSLWKCRGGNARVPEWERAAA